MQDNTACLTSFLAWVQRKDQGRARRNGHIAAYRFMKDFVFRMTWLVAAITSTQSTALESVSIAPSISIA
jgi:hypothetical protein